ncbi:hypothetical protein RFI_11453 [Reticulomyxa filosa]|uniref:Ubiquitin-like domain-containing protein n=1 Tax=Reticulomyxa filosa TaxID=46433 RepID=X6NIE9_RETFI|nr:hypothetical protein RFI_11453 [Reticulomyxa filosa]|eukprot:ETO25683.1 hypothetical protein RFI_11453 [Reticulomyxa filosa]
MLMSDDIHTFAVLNNEHLKKKKLFNYFRRNGVFYKHLFCVTDQNCRCSVKKFYVQLRNVVVWTFQRGKRQPQKKNNRAFSMSQNLAPLQVQQTEREPSVDEAPPLDQETRLPMVRSVGVKVKLMGETNRAIQIEMPTGTKLRELKSRIVIMYPNVVITRVLFGGRLLTDEEAVLGSIFFFFFAKPSAEGGGGRKKGSFFLDCAFKYCTIQMLTKELGENDPKPNIHLLREELELKKLVPFFLLIYNCIGLHIKKKKKIRFC